MTAHDLIRPTPSLMGIPLEIRLKIYQHIYTDLIAELSDNLFGVFIFYDHLYDYTSANLESHVGKTGLTTPLLYVCKQMYQEALTVLYEQAEFVVSIMGHEDIKDNERAGVCFSDDGSGSTSSRHLDFVRHLKINLEPVADPAQDEPEQTRFVERITKFLNLIHHGANLRSLEIHIPTSIGPGSVDGVLTALETIRLAGNSVKIYLDSISEEVLSEERLSLLLDAING